VDKWGALRRGAPLDDALQPHLLADNCCSPGQPAAVNVSRNGWDKQVFQFAREVEQLLLGMAAKP
jgi:hypothetical protein